MRLYTSKMKQWASGPPEVISLVSPPPKKLVELILAKCLMKFHQRPGRWFPHCPNPPTGWPGHTSHIGGAITGLFIGASDLPMTSRAVCFVGSETWANEDSFSPNHY